jgi:hypothetical protein
VPGSRRGVGNGNDGAGRVLIYGAMTRIEKLDDHHWAVALDVVEHLTPQPVTGMMVREIAIQGVHTKWIERNASLLLDLISPPGTALRDGTPVAKLQDALGLRAKDTRVNVALRCPRLRSAAAGIERFSATIGTLSGSHLDPRIVLIVENDQPGYTLTIDIPGPGGPARPRRLRHQRDCAAVAPNSRPGPVLG